MNARISAMLQYMLCVSRFAHYLKVAARDKIGSFAEAGECEDYLNHWLQQYVTSDSDAPRRGQGRVSAPRGQRAGARDIRASRAAICASPISGRISNWTRLTTALRITTELSPAQ